MTQIAELDGLILAISLFNAVLLIWLGMTIWLNAARRDWGVALVSAGFFAGAAFFIGHAAVWGSGFQVFAGELAFWWPSGSLPLVAAPLAWYVAMMWYAGYWSAGGQFMPSLHRIMLVVLCAAALVLAVGLLSSGRLPADLNLDDLMLGALLRSGVLPLLIVLYPIYIFACMLASIDVLRRPGPVEHPAGSQARLRARPWLTAAAGVLLLVCVLVSAVLVWLVLSGQGQMISGDLITSLAWTDLVIELLIAAAVVLMGQAVVRYEIFTGRPLPRRGLRRSWWRAQLLAAGCGLLVGASLSLSLSTIFALLLTVILMTVFFGLLNWRSHAERARLLVRLRPFVSRQGMYEAMMSANSPAHGEGTATRPDFEGPFRALVDQLLTARQAYLVPAGWLAPLVGSGLSYPGPGTPPVPLVEQNGDFVRITRLDPGEHGGLVWAIPLGMAGSRSGVLYLGEKRDQGLYTDEEIEVAGAVGERLVDMMASLEMATRLMRMQRQHLMESQLADRRTRRRLHDEILPEIHTAILRLHSGEGSAALAQLSAVHQAISDLIQAMPPATTPEFVRRGVLPALRGLLADEFGEAFDQLSWQVTPAGARALEALPALEAEVMFYAAREAIRNAARHGARPKKPLDLRIAISCQPNLCVTIEDSGIGFPLQDESSPAGRGLELHRTLMAIVGGWLDVESEPGAFTRVRLSFSRADLSDPPPGDGSRPPAS